MRFSEFRLDEDDFGNELGDFIEDDADHEADAALVDTLREIQFSAGDKKLPKITVTALMNLVKNKPGGEAFDLNALEKAKQNNEAVKSIVKSIEDDDNGVKYVFINPPEPIDGIEGEVGGEEGEGGDLEGGDLDFGDEGGEEGGEAKKNVGMPTPIGDGGERFLNLGLGVGGGEHVGHVTSGCLSPTLDKVIAMGYVPAELSAEGTEFEIDLGPQHAAIGAILRDAVKRRQRVRRDRRAQPLNDVAVVVVMRGLDQDETETTPGRGGNHRCCSSTRLCRNQPCDARSEHHWLSSPCQTDFHGERRLTAELFKSSK